MIDEISPHILRTVLGFGLGIALGFVARRSRFCTLGAIEDAVYAKDTGRLRAWVLAVAVAIIGVQALEIWAGLDLTRSIYTGPKLEWGAIVVGGLLFGLGMAFNGTCGFGTLLRLGGGDLKALVTFLVMAFSAGMAMRGITGLARVHLSDFVTIDLAPSASQRIPILLGLSGVPLAIAAIALGLALAIAAGAESRFRRSLRLVATGLSIGGLVVLGWWATGIAGFDPFETRRVESFSFVAPLAETLQYAMLASGLRSDFPVGAVAGVVIGAFLAARSAGQFRWEAPDDAREMRRHVVGAFLMGTGGIAALGCTIGQGVTGISTLSAGSILAVASILIGARLGLYWLVER